jgi:hypothetical protein
MLRRFIGILLLLTFITSGTGCIVAAPLLLAPLATGALVGAGAGALAVGFVYAVQKEQVLRDRQAAETKYRYGPEQGERVIIEAIEVAPNTVTNGDEVSLNTNFTVLTGNDQPVDMVVTQTITSQGRPVDKPLVDKASRKSGSYGISYSTKIPPNAPEGRFGLVTRVQAGNAMDEKTCEFIVAKKAASNQREIIERQMQKVGVDSKESPVQRALKEPVPEPAPAPAREVEAGPPTIATVRKAKKAQGLEGYIFQDRNSKKFFLEDSDGDTYKFEGGQWVKIGGQEPPVKAEDKVLAPERAPAPAREAEASSPTIDTVRKAKKAQGLTGPIFQDRTSGKWFLEDSDGNTYKFDGGQWKKIN